MQRVIIIIRSLPPVILSISIFSSLVHPLLGKWKDDEKNSRLFATFRGVALDNHRRLQKKAYTKFVWSPDKCIRAERRDRDLSVVSVCVSANTLQHPHSIWRACGGNRCTLQSLQTSRIVARENGRMEGYSVRGGNILPSAVEMNAAAECSAPRAAHRMFSPGSERSEEKHRYYTQ